MSKEAMKLALEALECSKGYVGCESWSPSMLRDVEESIKALEEALAKQEQGEPVAYTNGKEVILAKHWTADYPPEGWEPLGYTTPQQRTWVGLTDEERRNTLLSRYTELEAELILNGSREDYVLLEAKLKEKNT
jgi:hypothetical protein